MTATGLLLVAVSGLLSLLARPALGDRLRIRWAVGTHYGPETAPAALALAAFPVVAATSFVAFRFLAGRLETSMNEPADGVRLAFTVVAVATVGTILLMQVALVAANLLA